MSERMNKQKRLDFEAWWCAEELLNNTSEYSDEYLRGYAEAIKWVKSLDEQEVHL
jgi:hypothetical protein